METKGKIGIYFLDEIWKYHHELRQNKKPKQQVEWKYINGVFNTLGIGIEPTINYLMNSCTSFEEFEDWIEKNGRVSKGMVKYFNSLIINEKDRGFTEGESVFGEDDLEKWEQDGFVILREAISKEDCLETVDYICDRIGVNLLDKETWYNSHPLKQGIMIQLFNSTILDKNRLSRRIRIAFEQLWGKNNLMVSMDRVSFNPPESNKYQFPGPNLHWDVSLKQPIPFGIQGLLYLTDTDEDQGAFTVIPGFHKIINTWLEEIKTNPREINLLDSFGEKPISGKAGDLIIWNHCLPHGSRPNHSKSPRIVQYINYQPLDLTYQDEWI